MDRKKKVHEGIEDIATGLALYMPSVRSHPICGGCIQGCPFCVLP
ncbi:hypothetical protein BSM4216_3472 [Bacillus smithii]|nr:hypothetical protein BSM4216_3472 [Bacillus smithii]